VAAVALATALGSTPAYAAEGSIDHVENSKTGLKVLYSLPGAGSSAPDLQSLSVSLDGKPLAATATMASAATGESVRRTTILTMDVSASMRGKRFQEAKQAADVFLDSAPKDVYVGIVTFAKDVTVAQQPSLDRAASKSIIAGLSLQLATHLYDGVEKAVAVSGTQGQRSLLLLSDGRDTTSTPLAQAIKAVKDSGVKVDAVGLGQSARDQSLLKQITDPGNGSLINANDPSALSAVFANEAQTLADQILISVDVPARLSGSEGTLAVSIDSGGQSYTDEAFVTLGKASRRPAPVGVRPSTRLSAAPASGIAVPSNVMIGGLGAAGVGLLLLLVALFGGFGKKTDTVENRISAYTQKGRRRAVAPVAAQSQGVAAQAVGFATKALEGNKGLESAVGDRLDAAGMTLKPAEWLLLHAGIAVAAAALGFLMTSGSLVLTLVALLAGVLVPWLYLGYRRSRRLRAFNSQLAETLQLLAGSLQAGLSLAQGIDTVVREGSDPIAGEFRRALVETRLGVQIEDALESIGERMESADFLWTVMAVRIQREVGGNLAELLLNVAGTLREREYLRRQVKALSAEGRFSAYILLALPPGVLLYMYMTNRSYLEPLISTPVGYVMIGIMVTLMSLGAFTMKKMINLEV
jgi:tight adherence protein B